MTAYGAVPGDGQSDQVAFDRAIAAAGIAGTVFVPLPAHPRDSYIVDSLTLRDPQTLLGADRYGVLIEAARPGQGTGVRCPGTAHVKGVTIQYFGVGLDVRDVTYGSFEDIELDSNGVNLMVGGAMYNTTFDRIRMRRARERDLVAGCFGRQYASLNAVSFRDCGFETGQDGWGPFNPVLFSWCGGNGMTAISMTGCEFRGGVYFGGPGGVSGLTLHGNYFEGSGVPSNPPSIWLNNTRGASIEGNYFATWGRGAIWLECNDARDVFIAGNSFWQQYETPAVKIDHPQLCDCATMNVRMSANFFENSDANHRVIPLEDPAGCVVTTGPSSVPAYSAGGFERPRAVTWRAPGPFHRGAP